MAWAGDGAGQLPAILESGSSEEEEEEEVDEDDEEEDEDEEAALVQQPPLAQDSGDSEERLAELEQASQALLAELSALETQFEVERTCRQRAEAYAAQVQQENKQLKRLSLSPAPAPALPQEVPPEEEPDPAQRYEQQLRDLQEKISWLLEQRKDLTVQVQELQRKNQDLQDQLELGQEEQQRLRAALGTSQRALKSFKRVSQIVTQDYCEAVQQLELEQDLRLHAEAFAHEMLVQKKEANRQSSILLQSSGPSAQLLAALQEVARLTRLLEETRQEQLQRVKELEEELGRKAEPEELDAARAALSAAEEEKLRLQQRLREAEQRLAGLQEEAASLREKPPRDPQPAAPAIPPPPPLPPPPPAAPLDPLSAIRQRKGGAKRPCGQAGGEDAKARAVQEMMERIKNGVVLRPAKDRLPLGQDTAAGKRRSAALELQSILGAMRRASRRRSGRRRSLESRDAQLESILQRRRRAVDASPSPTLSPSSPALSPSPPPGAPQQGAGLAWSPETGAKDLAAAPWAEERVPFRARAGGGLPRTRPLPQPAGGRGELG